LPEHLRKKYARIESNPLVLICANISPHVTIEELQEYFNTLIRTLNPNINTLCPVKNVEISHNKMFAILEFLNKDCKKVLKQYKELEFQNYKMVIKRPQTYMVKLYKKNIEKKEEHI